MINVSTFFPVIILATIVFTGLPAYAEERAALNINDIIKNVSPENVTGAEFKAYYKTIEGKRAAGEGKVVYILPDINNRHKIRILTSASEPGKGYNVLLFTAQDARSELQKGDMISFEGEIGRVNSYMGVSIDMRGMYKKVSKQINGQ